MNAKSLKHPLQRVRSNHARTAGLIVPAGAVAGLVLLLNPPIGGDSPQSPALMEIATSINPTPRTATDPAWDRLSAIERQTLEPLQESWSALTAQQQAQWRLVVERVRSRPQHVQRRVAKRIDQWARLTPLQRAQARLNFLELAMHYSPRQRKQQWQAFQKAKPIEEHAISGGNRPRLIPPTFVQASPGATTVLLSQMYDLPSPDDGAEPHEARPDTREMTEEIARGIGAAPVAAGSAAELERP